MSFLPDRLIENLKLKKSLFLWRTLAALILIAALLLFSYLQYGGKFTASNSPYINSPYIGRLSINGFIGDNIERDNKIRALKNDKNIKALILRVNSPGGSIVGSESLYKALSDLGSAKPIVVVMESLAASGGYMISLVANYIIAHTGTITGSVGVIMQTPDISKLAEKIGVKMDIIRSGDLKGEPSMFTGMTKEARTTLQDSLNTAFDFFLSLVLKHRNISDPEIIKNISTGKIFVGAEALKSSLVDQIGDEQDAVDWLKGQNISAPVKDVNLFPTKSRWMIWANRDNSAASAIQKFLLEALQSPGILAVMPGYLQTTANVAA